MIDPKLGMQIVQDLYDQRIPFDATFHKFQTPGQNAFHMIITPPSRDADINAFVKVCENYNVKLSYNAGSGFTMKAN